MTIRRAIKPFGRAIPINWEMPLMTADNQNGISISSSLGGGGYQFFDNNQNTSLGFGREKSAMWVKVTLPYDVIVERIEVQQNPTGNKWDCQIYNARLYADLNFANPVTDTFGIGGAVYAWYAGKVNKKVKTRSFAVYFNGQPYFGCPGIKIFGKRIK